MVYHSHLDTSQCQFACGLPLIPLKSRADHTATESRPRDIVDDSLYAFRANILFRNFEVKGAADKLLIYLTLFINLCLKRIADTRVNKAGANALVFQLAHEVVKVPGDSGFALGGLLTPPVDKQEEGAFRLYVRQCREQAGQRLVEKCFDTDAAPSKYWLAFAQKRFLNKLLT